MAMTLNHVSELLQEATSKEPFERLDVSMVFPLAVGAGAVDPDLITPTSDAGDIEEVIAFRCCSL